jgi:hypothetical protein
MHTAVRGLLCSDMSTPGMMLDLLSGADFCGADFRGADLSGAVMWLGNRKVKLP